MKLLYSTNLRVPGIQGEGEGRGRKTNKKNKRFGKSGCVSTRFLPQQLGWFSWNNVIDGHLAEISTNPIPRDSLWNIFLVMMIITNIFFFFCCSLIGSLPWRLDLWYPLTLIMKATIDTLMRCCHLRAPSIMASTPTQRLNSWLWLQTIYSAPC